MAAFIIENHGEVKESFSYERPLNADSRHALLEYARANYGADAILRNLTEEQLGVTSPGDSGSAPRVKDISLTRRRKVTRARKPIL